MTAQPLDWIKQLSPAILQLDQVPLFGKAPVFPWDKLSTELSRVFQIGNIQIVPTDSQWRNPDQLAAGIGSQPVFVHCSFSPLEGTFGWVMAQDDIDSLMRILLKKEPHSFDSIDPDFQKGFYRFLMAQVIQIINKLDFDKNLSPSLYNEPVTNEQPAFCIDASIKFLDKTMNGRIILSPELCHSWRERYANRKLGFDYSGPLAQKLQVIVHLEAGKTELSQADWNKVVVGDFIMLDFCSFEPDSDKGRVMMTVEGVPLFRARIKQGSIKILEFPLYHEVEAPMNKNEDDEDEFEESEIEETEEEDFDEDEDEEEDEEEDFDEEELTEESEAEVKKPERKELAAKAAAPGAPPAAPAEKHEFVKPEELSLTIVVEVGRLQMSIQKLMELQPGNVLDLNIYPENGVDLVVNGRRVGKGELLKVGETLGVRVLDIG